jgi:phage tail sheath protein FI
MGGYIEEIPRRPAPIEGVAVGTAGFAGPDGPEAPVLVTGVAELVALLGDPAATPLARMVAGFFANGGRRAVVARALADLDAVDGVALLCPLPEDRAEAIACCEHRRDRLAIVSLPEALADVAAVLAARPAEPSPFAALHHPWVRAGGHLTPPGGHVAGLYARSDEERGVAHAPTSLALRGLDAPPLERLLTTREIEQLGAGAVNVLRPVRGGVRVWGARTFTSDAEWKYVNVRRLLIFLEASIARGLRWAVFEPNAERLWGDVRRLVEDFLFVCWRDGGLQGRRAEDAFFVRCDRSTMTQDDLDDGRLICLIGVAPVKPAEFVIFRVGMWTADRPDP